VSVIQALGYVGLTVSDLQRWNIFATHCLGLQAAFRDDKRLDLRMDAYAMRLSLTVGPADDIEFVGWEVRDAQDLESLGATLQQRGIAVTEGAPDEARQRFVKSLIKFRDPEGLQSEAYYGPLQRTNEPFLSSAGVRFKTGRGGLGHIVLVAQDLEAQESFYRDVLGFRVSDYIHTDIAPATPLRLTFMRCNSRHHSLALAQLPLKKKLQHLMIEVESIDDVGRAMYRCADGGCHVSLTLGRHSNDEMVSFYPQSPSGFDIEYGWSGLEVDDETWHVLTHDTTSAWGHRFRRLPKLSKPDGAPVDKQAGQLKESDHAK
jgi:2,3-dihydroxybiphenyl 1,2-dioxygenase